MSVCHTRGILACGAAAVALTVLSSGCETYGTQRRKQSMQVREDVLVVQEDNRRLGGRIESLEIEIDRLRQELNRATAEASNAARAEVQSLDARVDGLERSIQDLDRKRQADKEEIVDTLSKKITQVMQSSAPRGSSRRRSSSEYVYEHVVKGGETLSEISAAYGVSVKAIMDENNISNPNMLRAGQVLYIPE